MRQAEGEGQSGRLPGARRKSRPPALLRPAVGAQEREHMLRSALQIIHPVLMSSSQKNTLRASCTPPILSSATPRCVSWR